MSFAFLVQGYVTQTHIHISAQADAGFAAAKFLGYTPSANAAHAQKGERDPFPANGDPEKCPLCQEILHSGVYVAPTTVALFLPFHFVSIIPIAIAVSHLIETISHAWQGRAPPSA